MSLFLAAGCDRTEVGEDVPAEQAPEENDLAETIGRPAEGGAVHLVRLVQRGDAYSFDPDSLSIRSGDVIRLIMTGSQPESVAFDAAGDSVGAYIRQAGLDRGVLLTDEGEAFDIRFADAPAGQYPFRSIPHGDLGMRGVLTVSGD